MAEAAEHPEPLYLASISASYELLEKDPYVWRIMVDALNHTGGVTDSQLHAEICAGIAAVIGRSFELAGKQVAPERIVRYAETMRCAVPGLAAWWWHNREVSREQIVETIHDLFWTCFEQMAWPDAIRATPVYAKGNTAPPLAAGIAVTGCQNPARPCGSNTGLRNRRDGMN